MQIEKKKKKMKRSENKYLSQDSVTGVCFRGDEAFSRGDATDLG